MAFRKAALPITKEIFFTKRELIEVNQHLNELYKRKNEINKEIQIIKNKLKSLRELRDSYSKTIDALMEERQKTIEVLNSIKEQIKALNRQKRDLTKNKNINLTDINKIKAELEKYEYVLQTEILNFYQERKIWNKIKQLRKLLGKYEELAVILEELDKIKREYDAYKSKLEIIRDNIKKNIEERQKVKEEIKNLKEKLVNLIEERQKIREEIIQYKTKFSELDEKLKNLLEEFVTKGVEQATIKREAIPQRRPRKKLYVSPEEISKIKEDYERIQEKIIMGETLTTEDILILQRYEILKEQGLITE